MTLEELAEKVDAINDELSSVASLLTAMGAVMEHVQELIVEQVIGDAN